MNKKKILLTSLFAVSALSSVGFVQLSKNTSNITKTDSELDASAITKATTSGLTNLSTDTTVNGQINVPTNYYQQNSFKNLSNDNGPILLFDDAKTFGANDWYGNPSWYITLGASDGYYSAAWFSTSTSSTIDFAQAGTKVVDWAYNHKTDNLYVLTDTQYLIIVASKTGTIVSTNKVGNDVNKIQIIDFNSSVYLWNNKIAKPTIYVIEPQTGMVKSNVTSTSFLNSKYLYGIIPLDTNYSIAVTSTTAPSETDVTVSLSLDFVDDNLNNITGPTTQTISLNNTKAADIYLNGFKRDSDYVIFIQNKIYSVSLNKSAMQNSKFTDLLDANSNSSLGNFTALTEKVNSAFIDSNNQIYFKTSNSTDITSLSVNNSFNNMQISTTTLGSVFASKETSAKSAQVFAVPVESQNEIISRGYTGYILGSTDFTGTGFTNGSILTNTYTSRSLSPLFTITGSSSTSSIPSSVNSTNITTNNGSLSNVTLETSNAILIADDLSGTLFVKVPYTITGAWYGNGSATVRSRGYLIGKFQYLNIKQATTWATNLPQAIRNYEPSQITTTMLKENATSIITIPQSILVLTDSQLDINFVIESSNGANGTITLFATISYKNAYGSIVNYSMTTNKQYNVKKESANYAFLFAGQTDSTADKNKVQRTEAIGELITKAQSLVSDESQTEFLNVDVGSLSSVNTIFNTYTNVLPSLWSAEVVKSYFIAKNDKYPSDPTITLIPSDSTGSIIIIVQYNNLSNSTPSKFAIRYNGITNYSTSAIRFSGSEMTIKSNRNPNEDVFPDQKILNITTVSGFSDYDENLVSSLDPNSLSALYNSQLITTMGFEPTVSFVSSSDANNQTDGITTYDEEYGSFLLKIDFSQSVSRYFRDSTGNLIPFSQTPFANQMGLTNGVIYQRFGGLLPIGSTYNISIDRSSTSYRSLITNNNVNASLSETDILSILTINGYDTSKGDTIRIENYRWNGEVFEFSVFAHSATYDSISTRQTFGVSWSPKFASIRNMSLSVAVITSVVGITLVSLAIALYIVRRNKIRRLLK
ncbi:hypothetical protein D8X55_02840 [Malacoplasma penetrans]|uniref:Uncharacterized protein n=1 Tax=Malacoplasma penetrans (strain HF-2) TaxID=272633 RepID=Q8EUZ5_MALP2|nr:hypothetical protein [Malacoplasma penetrans]RXY96731.1 hypothetical protein D8X55_02840 [Malacoplasma penetrans]BAC44566.1 conserved hypothetical protein [Malacoplasma penetrans HF-2]